MQIVFNTLSDRASLDRSDAEMTELEKIFAETANMTDDDIKNETEEQTKQYRKRLMAALRQAEPNPRLNNDNLLKLLGATQEGMVITRPSSTAIGKDDLPEMTDQQ